ncbi:E3 ubiquitin-protein ligase RNF128a isoform X2 [Chanos chanos]|uniref:E3 ubiquitin-protein ligase RNF128a isoform X2 n=1 Tax=Chanos chanos TaxID=29144 RepID=A0A6J2VXS9_CHACN|nr:E3 ubiquitin-protein ligase RNF128 isoform X2 [Chanos chanos]
MNRRTMIPAICLTLFTHIVGASAFPWTARVEISYHNRSTSLTEHQACDCGLYGLDSPLVPVRGQLVLPTNPLGCGPLTQYNHSGGCWVALVQRGNCTFAEKILNAQQHGAIATVIYNLPGTGDKLTPMKHHGTGDMVAVMIGYMHGMEFVRLLREGVTITMAIEMGKQHGPWMSHYSVFFVSISFFIVTAATVGYFIFYSARRLNSVRLQNRKQKQLKAEAKKAIGQLQVRTLKQGDVETGPDADTCAVCIDAYKPGDVLSILTCNHFFHKTCIEPWLLEHRTCPMCKCDILKALGVELDVEDPPQLVPMPPDFRSFSSVTEEFHSETTSHTHSETTSHTHSDTASSGYASIQGTQQHSPMGELLMHNGPERTSDLGAVQVEVQPHYDNPAFENDVRNQREART